MQAPRGRETEQGLRDLVLAWFGGFLRAPAGKSVGKVIERVPRAGGSGRARMSQGLEVQE